MTSTEQATSRAIRAFLLFAVALLPRVSTSSVASIAAAAATIARSAGTSSPKTPGHTAGSLEHDPARCCRGVRERMVGRGRGNQRDRTAVAGRELAGDRRGAVRLGLIVDGHKDSVGDVGTGRVRTGQ